MPSGTTPNELKQRLSAGMLSFPLTDFDAQDEYDARASAQRLEWLTGFDSAAVFMAGGAGEFFSLSPAEYSAVISTGVKRRRPTTARDRGRGLRHQTRDHLCAGSRTARR